MKKKFLKIINASRGNIDLKPNKDTDFLVLKMDQMYYFQQNNIKFITLECFYDNSYQNNLEFSFIPKMKEWLIQSDKSIYDQTKTENLFSGNGFWFMHKFLDLFYAQNCINKIKEKYSKIEIITDNYIEKMQPSKINLGALSFNNFLGQGSDRFLILLIHLMPKIKIINIKKNFSFRNYFYYLYSKIIWFYFGVIRKINKIYQNFIKINKNKFIFYNLQDGYDLDKIKHYSSGTKFINIKNIIINEIENNYQKNKLNLSQDIIKSSKFFFRNHLPSFEGLLIKLVNEYILISINIIKNFPEKELCYFKEKKVDGIVLPMCAQDLIDFYVVKTANKFDIPTYFFKHNGPIEIFRNKDPFVSFLEQNKVLNRTQFMHSNLEKELMKKNKTIRIEVVRSLGMNYKENKNIQKNKAKILYATGSPSRYTLKDLQSITFDNEKINFLKSIIDYTIESDSKLSIKSHPRGNKEINNMLLSIRSGLKKSSKINIIYHNKIEELFDQYDLIVSDTIFSSVVSNALYTNKNILVYCPRKDCITHEYYDLLSKRVSLVHDLIETKKIINELKTNNFKYMNDPDFNKTILGTLSFEEAIEKILITMKCK
mgnify:CR=1 FL=1